LLGISKETGEILGNHFYGKKNVELFKELYEKLQKSEPVFHQKVEIHEFNIAISN